MQLTIEYNSLENARTWSEASPKLHEWLQGHLQAFFGNANPKSMMADIQQHIWLFYITHLHIVKA